MAGDKIEGVEGGELEAFFAVFFDDGDGQEAMAQGDAGATEFAEGQRMLGSGDAIEPWNTDIEGEFVEVFFLIEDIGIEHIIEGRLLPRGRVFDDFFELGEVIAAAAACGL